MRKFTFFPLLALLALPMSDSAEEWDPFPHVWKTSGTQKSAPNRLRVLNWHCEAEALGSDNIRIFSVRCFPFRERPPVTASTQQPLTSLPAQSATPRKSETARMEADLYEALKANDIAAVTRLVKQPVDLNHLYQPALLDNRATAYHSAPFLYWALLFRCREEILKALVASRASVNFRFNEPEDVTLLMQAAYQFPAQSVRFLLDHGAQVNASTQSGRTALMFAVTDGDPALGGRYGAEAAVNASLLISRGAHVRIRDSNGRTAAMVAAQNYQGSDAALLVLLSHGAKVNEADAAGATPLMYASQPANLKAVKLLLKRGARVQAYDGEGRTPLLYALYPHCSKDDLGGVIQALCQAGVNINAQDRQGETALDYATGWEERLGSAQSFLERFHAVHGKNPILHRPAP